MCFHAQEDSIGSQTGQTPFKVGLAPKFLSFSIKVIQRSDSLFKLLPINPVLQLGRELALELAACPTTVVTLDEHFARHGRLLRPHRTAAASLRSRGRRRSLQAVAKAARDGREAGVGLPGPARQVLRE